MGDQTEEIVETVETTVTHTESVEVHETTEFTEIVEVTETIVTSGKAAEGAGATGGKNRPDLSSFSSEDQEKIGRIQAQGRGYIARKNVEEKKSYRETTTSEIKETKQQSGTAAGGSLTTTELTESRTTTEENETKETVETTEELITEAVTVGGGNIASLEDWNSGAADAGADAAGAESGAVPCIDGQPKPHEQPDPAGPQSSERDSASGRVHGASAAAQDVPGTEAPSAVSSEPVHFVPASGDAPRNPKPLGTGLSTVAPAAQKHKASEPAADKPAGVAASLEAQGGQGGGGDHVPSQTDRAPARASESAFAQQDGSQTAMVTFVVKPENIKYAREVKLSLNCLDLKSELYDELRILPEALTLKLGEAEWYAHMSLRELGVKGGDDVELELVIDMTRTPKQQEPLAPEELPAMVEVLVDMGPGQAAALVQVAIDQTEMQKKLYLGGFRNKKTGALYHHACTQTPRKPKYSEADRKLSRETQTFETKSLHVQTTREQATQMRRPGVLLDDSGDYVLIPGPYMTADELLRLKEQKTIVLQCWARAWLARRRANELRKQKMEREEFLQQQERSRAEEEAAKRRYEIQRRMHPRTAADFEILYNELEAWRLQETSKIKSAGLDEEAARNALAQLLSKEAKLLQTIDRLKTAANQENKAMRVAKTLKDMSAPKKWDLSNGRVVQVHTPFTTRAKELAQLYNGLNLPLLTTDERLDVLLHVKWTVKEFDCNLTREIVELVDREADLLNRGRSPKTMEGLRKRISSLFLAFIETPEFNPEAGRFQIVPLDFDGYQQSPIDGQAPRSFGTVTG